MENAFYIINAFDLPSIKERRASIEDCFIVCDLRTEKTYLATEISVRDFPDPRQKGVLAIPRESIIFVCRSGEWASFEEVETQIKRKKLSENEEKRALEWNNRYWGTLEKCSKLVQEILDPSGRPQDGWEQNCGLVGFEIATPEILNLNPKRYRIISRTPRLSDENSCKP